MHIKKSGENRFFASVRQIKLRGMAGDLMLLVFIRMVTMVLGLIVTKLMAVHFSLQQYGTYSQATLIQNTATSISILGLTDAVNFFYNKAATQEEKQRYLSTIFNLQYGLGSLCAVLILLFQIPIIQYFHNEDLKSVLLYVAWLPLVNNLLPMLQVLFVSIGKTKQIALRNLAVSLIQLLAVCIACYATKDIQIIFILLLVSGILQVWYFKVTFDREAVRIRIQCGDKRLLPDILKFSVPMAFSVATNSFTRDIDKYVVSYFSDTQTLAIYTNAAKVLPFDLVTSSMLTILVPVLTRQIAGENYEKARETFRTYLRLGYMFTWLMVAGAIAMSRELMVTLYSEQYLPGLAVFVTYLVVDMIRFSNASVVLTAKGKSRRLMLYSFGSLAANGLLNVLFYQAFGILGPALATLLVTVGMNLMLLREAGGILHAGVTDFFDGKEVALVLVRLGFGCILALGIKQFMRQITQESFFILLAGYGTYFIVTVLLNKKRLLSCYRNLNQIK